MRSRGWRCCGFALDGLPRARVSGCDGGECVGCAAADSHGLRTLDGGCIGWASPNRCDPPGAGGGCTGHAALDSRDPAAPGGGRHEPATLNATGSFGHRLSSRRGFRTTT